MGTDTNAWVQFLHLRVATFIEATVRRWRPQRLSHFPSFLEGLSLRHGLHPHFYCGAEQFPFLLEGTFIEADILHGVQHGDYYFFAF